MAKRARKLVYTFGAGRADGDAGMKELLGGKGANLAEMVRIGIPVPPGFTMTTEVCGLFFRGGNRLPRGLAKEVRAALAGIREITGKSFGDPSNPLLVSVRSGAPASMPGMMDTILNLGINDDVAERMAELTGNERFVYDAYRRFVMMYADVVLGVHRHAFEQLVDRAKVRLGVESSDNSVTIRVQDSGPGMDEALQDRIFDRFYRGDTSRSTPGFGLGLSIAKSLTEAQGGTIEVASEVGVGSTFIVALPAG